MESKTFGDLPTSVESAVMKDSGPVAWKTSSDTPYYKSFSEFAKANPDKAKYVGDTTTATSNNPTVVQLTAERDKALSEVKSANSSIAYLLGDRNPADVLNPAKYNQTAGTAKLYREYLAKKQSAQEYADSLQEKINKLSG